MAASKPARKRIPPKPGARPVKARTTPSGGIVLPEPVPDLPLLRTSERGQFKRCTWRWWQGSVLGLQLAGTPSLPLWFGTGWHLVMAHHYGPLGTKRGKDPHGVWKEYVNDELVKIRINAKGESYEHEQYIDAETLGHLMIDAYLDRYKGDPSWHVIQVERVGFVLIPRPGTKEPMIQYAVTYDLVYRDEETGWILLGEHKTAKQISVNHLDLDPQGGSYFAVATHDLRSAGKIGPNESLKGIMYNFVRKAPPDDRELAEDGLAHNKPNKEHYITAFDAEGIDAEEYSSGRGIANLKKLEEIASDYGLKVIGDVSKNQPTDNFKRQFVARTRHEVKAQITSIQNDALSMEAYRTGQLPLTKNPTKDCSWDCSFKDICLLHERGGDWEELRDALYVQGDPYEPYRDQGED